MTAEATAIAQLKEAQTLVNQAFDAQGEAAKRGADATAAALREAQGQLTALQTQLADVTKTVAAGIHVSIEANADAVTKTVASLDEQIEKRDRLMLIKADITTAQVEAQDYSEGRDARNPFFIEPEAERVATAVLDQCEPGRAVDLLNPPPHATPIGSPKTVGEMFHRFFREPSRLRRRERGSSSLCK